MSGYKVVQLGTVTPRKFGQLVDVNMAGVADGNLVAYAASTKTFVPYTGSGDIPPNLNIFSLNVSGVSTFGGVTISNGIVTSSTPGFSTVVYYGDGSNLTGVVGLTSYVPTAGFSTFSNTAYNIYGGQSGNLVYQSSSGVTTFIPNGTIGQLLTFNGTIPVWQSFATHITGINIFDEGNLFGSVTGINFVGDFISVSGIGSTATITLSTPVISYVPTSGFSTAAGIASYSNFAGISTYSGSSGISSFSNISGISSYSNISGISTFSIVAGFSTFSGISTFANTSGISTFSLISGYSTNAGISTNVVGGIAFVNELNVTGIGTIRNLGVTSSLILPLGASATPIQRNIYVVGDKIRYRDSSNNERNLLNATDNLQELTNIGIARSNLGLGVGATLGIGTTANTLAAGDDFRFAELKNRLDLFRESATFYVSKLGNNSNDGSSVGEPFLTVGAAVNAANQFITNNPGSYAKILIGPGLFVETTLPFRLKPNILVQGALQRGTVLQPAPGQELNGFFALDSGCMVADLRFAGHQASGTSELDSNIGTRAWAISFNEQANSGLGVYLTASPYIKDCASITAEDDSGLGGSTSTGDTGGGVEVDGNKCHPDSPLRSMLCYGFTQQNLGGPGCVVKNDGYAELVSFFGLFGTWHVQCETGGQATLSGGGCSEFGIYGLVADGYSSTSLFTGTLRVPAPTGQTFVDVVGITSNRLGSSNRPPAGQILLLNSNTYVVQSSLPIDSSGNIVGDTEPTRTGYRVNIYNTTAVGIASTVPQGTVADFRQRSQISAGCHSANYVGSGTNYKALPWNGGVPNRMNEAVERNFGRVFGLIVNDVGDIKVAGGAFSVDGTTGAVTINTDEFNLSGLNAIGPFSRNDGVSTVGVQLQEVSNNVNLIASTGASDGNTAPTQFAVRSFTDNRFLTGITTSVNQPIVITDTSTQDGNGFWSRTRNISLVINAPNGVLGLNSSGNIPSNFLPTYVQNSGVSTYASIAGYSTVAGFSTISGIATYSNISGFATYAVVSGYSTNSGISSYADLAGTVNYATISGISTYANLAGYSTAAGIATVASGLQTNRTFQITGDIIATPQVFNGTQNVSFAATIQPNSVGLGTNTYGAYVSNIVGTVGEIEVTNSGGEGSIPQIGLPDNVGITSNLNVGGDLQLNKNLNVNGNITIGGTSAYIIVDDFIIKDRDIVVGYTTNINNNDVSNDVSANTGGLAIASTEGNPLVNLVIAGIETLPATYKKIMWFQKNSFVGLETDAWLFNYAVGIGSTQLPSGTRFASGDIQFTERSISRVNNINASGIISANSFVGIVSYSDVSGYSVISGYSTSSGIATYAVTSGYSTNSGIASYSNNSGYSTSSGIAAYSNNAGYSTSSGIATYAVTSGISSYSVNAGISTYANTSGYSTNSGISTYSIIAGYSSTSGIATFASTSNSSGFASVSGYSTNSGITTFANIAGISTYAVIAGYSTSSGISTSVSGGIGNLTSLNVTGVITSSSIISNVGTITTLGISSSLIIPLNAPLTPASRNFYSVADTIRYRDTTNTERLLLNATDNLANLADPAAALANLGGLPLTFTSSTITYAATIDLDMAARNGTYQTISLAGNLTLTTSNRAAGRTVTLRLICDATQRNLTVPAGWVFVGTKPSNIAANKTGVLSLTFFGTADTDCVAAYGVQS